MEDWGALFAEMFPHQTSYSDMDVVDVVKAHLNVCEAFPTTMYMDGTLEIEEFEENYAEFLHHLTVDDVLFEACCVLHSLCPDLIELDDFVILKLKVLTEITCGCCRDNMLVLDWEINQTIAYLIKIIGFSRPSIRAIAQQVPMLAPLLKNMLR